MPSGPMLQMRQRPCTASSATLAVCSCRNLLATTGVLSGDSIDDAGVGVAVAVAIIVVVPLAAAISGPPTGCMEPSSSYCCTVAPVATGCGDLAGDGDGAF